MRESVLFGRGRQLIEVPRTEWEDEHLAPAPQHIRAKLGFMSEAHHLVRYFVVEELPRAGEPLSPEFIAARLNLKLRRVNAILDDLEKHLTFLFRNEQGAVAWAYPVTVDSTPHHVTFSTGEQVQAA